MVIMAISKKRAAKIARLYEKGGYELVEKEEGLSNRETIGRYLRKSRENATKESAPNDVKILIFDIETSFILVEAFSLFGNNYLSHEAIHRDWHLLTWSAMWLHDDNIMSDKLTPKESKDGNDKRIVQSLWDLFHNATMVVAHNGLKFDMKKFNVRMMANNLPPYSSVRVIDTLKEVKKIAGHTSNRLDYISKFYDIGGKIHTDRTLWHDCTFGTKKERKEALKTMSVYNDMDVQILADTYIKLRPYMRNHPNVGVYYNDNKERCHRCGSEDLTWNDGDYYTTNVSKFPLCRCGNCGGYTPSRNTTLSLTKRKSLLKSMP